LIDFEKDALPFCGYELEYGLEFVEEFIHVFRLDLDCYLQAEAW